MHKKTFIHSNMTRIEGSTNDRGGLGWVVGWFVEFGWVDENNHLNVLSLCEIIYLLLLSLPSDNV